MTRDVLVVGPGFPMVAAWRLMQERRIRHVPVIAGGRLRGILSDRDVLLHSTPGPDGAVVAPRTPVAAAMTTSPIHCAPNARVSELAGLMLEHKIDAIPVVATDGALVGLVTSSDLLFLLVEELQGRVLPFDFRLYDADSLKAMGD